GAIDKNIINKVIDSIINYDSLTAISCVDEIIKKGKDLRQFTFELTTEFLNRLIKTNENKDRYISIIDRLSSLDNDLKSTTRKEIVLKACLVQLCNFKQEKVHSISSNNSTQVDEIYQKKIENLEREVKELKE